MQSMKMAEEEEMAGNVVSQGLISCYSASTDETAQLFINACIKMFEVDYKLAFIGNENGKMCDNYPARMALLGDKDSETSTVKGSSGPLTLEKAAQELEEIMSKAAASRCRHRFVVPVIFFNGKYVCRSATLSGNKELYVRIAQDVSTSYWSYATQLVTSTVSSVMNYASSWSTFTEEKPLDYKTSSFWSRSVPESMELAVTPPEDGPPSHTAMDNAEEEDQASKAQDGQTTDGETKGEEKAEDKTTTKDDKAQGEKTETEGQTTEAEKAEDESTLMEEYFANKVMNDKKLLDMLNVTHIFDLMVEDAKVKFGMVLSSSEKADEEKRYKDFNLYSFPYPGCEFFKDWKDWREQKDKDISTLHYNWGEHHNNAELTITDDNSVLHQMGIKWNEQKTWDLELLTLNYVKAMVKLIVTSDEGMLVHCISGWDRTPLFISLLRLSLWADGLIHPSLNAPEMMLLTIAYDWYLFGHDFADRRAKGQEIMPFCFAMLHRLGEEEYSAHTFFPETKVKSPEEQETTPQKMAKLSTDPTKAKSPRQSTMPQKETTLSGGSPSVKRTLDKQKSGPATRASPSAKPSDTKASRTRTGSGAGPEKKTSTKETSSSPLPFKQTSQGSARRSPRHVPISPKNKDELKSAKTERFSLKLPRYQMFPPGSAPAAAAVKSKVKTATSPKSAMSSPTAPKAGSLSAGATTRSKSHSPVKTAATIDTAAAASALQSPCKELTDVVATVSTGSPVRKRKSQEGAMDGDEPSPAKKALDMTEPSAAARKTTINEQLDEEIKMNICKSSVRAKTQGAKTEAPEKMTPSDEEKEKSPPEGEVAMETDDAEKAETGSSVTEDGFEDLKEDLEKWDSLTERQKRLVSVSLLFQHVYARAVGVAPPSLDTSKVKEYTAASKIGAIFDSTTVSSFLTSWISLSSSEPEKQAQQAEEADLSWVVVEEDEYNPASPPRDDKPVLFSDLNTSLEIEEALADAAVPTATQTAVEPGSGGRVPAEPATHCDPGFSGQVLAWARSDGGTEPSTQEEWLEALFCLQKDKLAGKQVDEQKLERARGQIQPKNRKELLEETVRQQKCLIKKYEKLGTSEQRRAFVGTENDFEKDGLKTLF